MGESGVERGRIEIGADLFQRRCDRIAFARIDAAIDLGGVDQGFAGELIEIALDRGVRLAGAQTAHECAQAKPAHERDKQHQERKRRVDAGLRSTGWPRRRRGAQEGAQDCFDQ